MQIHFFGQNKSGVVKKVSEQFITFIFPTVRCCSCYILRIFIYFFMFSFSNLWSKSSFKQAQSSCRSHLLLSENINKCKVMRASSQIERQMANKRQTAKYTHQFAPDEQLKSHAHAHTRTCSICVWRIKALDGIKYNTCEWRLSANEHAESWRIEVFSCK